MTASRPIVSAAAACALAGSVAILAAQDERQTFRTGVDVIQLDVSVLDKARRPVVGLKAGDFVVLENGKPQQIVSVEEADAADRDPLPSAWMRYVARDVVANDLGDQLGDGRLAAIVIDDRNLPGDDVPIAMSTRALGHYLIDELGPSDRMAVVFAMNSGFTQDFTDDHRLLGLAVDRFDLHGGPVVEALPGRGGLIDNEWRSRPGFARPACLRNQPVVPTLDAVVSRLATVPGRRKTLFLISVGAPVAFGSPDPCQSDLAKEMQTLFEKAKRGNVNIHALDPTGYRGYERYLRERAPAWGRVGGPGRDWTMPTDPQVQFDFLRVTADSTGGRVVVDADPIEPAIDRLFEEDRSYYLIGYTTSNSNPDGKFHKVDVRTRRGAYTVRTRSGYWASSKDAFLSEREDAAPTSLALALSGLTSGEGLPLRLNVVPLGPVGRPDPATGRVDDDVAVTLSVGFPPMRAAAEDTITIVRNIYDAEGRPGEPVEETERIALEPSFGESVRRDHAMRLSLPPGRTEMRVNASSALLGRTGSVFASVELPDFAKAPLDLSAVALGRVPDDDAPMPEVFRRLLPIVPTANREYASGDKVSAFVRVFEAGAPAGGPVIVTARVFDAGDQTKFVSSASLAAADFAADRSAGYQVALPLASLARGPYLLSLSAESEAGGRVRRDVLFRIR